jgi:hypothetical protein
MRERLPLGSVAVISGAALANEVLLTRYFAMKTGEAVAVPAFPAASHPVTVRVDDCARLIAVELSRGSCTISPFITAAPFSVAVMDVTPIASVAEKSTRNICIDDVGPLRVAGSRLAVIAGAVVSAAVAVTKGLTPSLLPASCWGAGLATTTCSPVCARIRDAVWATIATPRHTASMGESFLKRTPETIGLR